MKNKFLAPVLFSVLAVCSTSAFSYSNGSKCADKETILAVKAGLVIDSLAGADGGHGIRVMFSNGNWVPTNGAYNLNDERGRALFAMLMTAMTTGKKVTTYDHFDGDTCNDFDEIIVWN